MPSTRNLLTVAIPVTAASYVVYRVNALNTAYPLLPGRPYHQMPSILASLPYPHDEPDYMYTRVPSSTTLDSFTKAFYATWTLRVEALLARLTGYASIPSHSETYLNGLFPIIHRTPSSTVMAWRMPGPVLAFFKALNTPMVAGGTQELTAVPVDGQVEIGYACAQNYGRADEYLGLGLVGLELHRFYMRFLLDAAKRRLERQARQR